MRTKIPFVKTAPYNGKHGEKGSKDPIISQPIWWLMEAMATEVAGLLWIVLSIIVLCPHPPPRPRERPVLANAKIKRTRCACGVTGAPTIFRRRGAPLARTLRPGRGDVSEHRPRHSGVVMVTPLNLGCTFWPRGDAVGLIRGIKSRGRLYELFCKWGTA